jgi:hypothetical protein
MTPRAKPKISRRRGPRGFPLKLVLLGVIVAGLSLPAARTRTAGDRGKSTEIVLFDFEQKSQLDRLRWQCGTVFSLTSGYAADGRWSLKVEMYPAGEEWPGFVFGLDDGVPENCCLELTVDNPRPSPLTMLYRIDDRPRNPPYGDRLNGRVILQPGRNRLVFDFTRLTTSKTHRRLTPEKIRGFYLFLPRPREKTVIYIDYVILTADPAP